ncbi:MAG: phenylacetate--CoA ligase [Lentisphaeria bacterium]
MSSYWQPDLETAAPDTLRNLRTRALRRTLRQAARSPYYRELFQRLKIRPEQFRSPEDIRRLPFTTKDDLRSHYPYGFLAVPKEETVRLHCSSGTTGNPTVVFHNQHDLDSWANLMARSMYCAGARSTDVFQNISGYGLFTGGLGFQYGAERLGALTIPAGAGNTRRQIKLMQDFGTTVIHAIPSYLPRLREGFAELGLEPGRDTQLRIICTGAEPHTEETRRRLEAMFTPAKVFNSFGLSEMNGPGVAFECEHQCGLHVWEDAYIAEIIHPDTLEPLPDGELGELVFTSLDRQAMPLLRYRTRDLTRFIPGPCACGRVHRRLDRIAGRSDDMFIIKGCNVFPQQIERVLMRIPQAASDYLIVLETVGDNDELILQVEAHPEWFTGDPAHLEEVRRRMVREIRDEVLVTPLVQLVEPGSLPRTEGKAKRVDDRRNRKG